MDYPVPPDLIVDTVSGTLNGESCPIVLWQDVEYSGTGPELNPIRIDSYSYGGVYRYLFGGSFILPWDGMSPPSQYQVHGPTLGSTATADTFRQSELPFAVFMYYPAYVYGTSYSLSVAMHVRQAFCVNLLVDSYVPNGSPGGVSFTGIPTPTNGWNPTPTQVTNKPVFNVTLTSGIQHKAYGAAYYTLGDADVNLKLSTNGQWEEQTGANPWGVTAGLGGSTIRWYSVNFIDPDTGQKITLTYNYEGASKTTIENNGQYITYTITMPNSIFNGVTNYLPPTSNTANGYEFGVRNYIPAPVLGYHPNYSDPYVSVPNVNTLNIFPIQQVQITKSVYNYGPGIGKLPPYPTGPNILSNYVSSPVAAISAPTGGGSLLTTAAMTTTNVSPGAKTWSFLYPTLTCVTAVNYNQGPILVSQYRDGGQTFDSGADIGAKNSAGNLISGLSGSGTVTDTWTLTNGISWTYTGRSYSSTLSFIPVNITQFLADTSGRLYINGVTGSANTPWEYARITDDATGRSGWRDADTANYAPVGSNPAPDPTFIAFYGRGVNASNQGVAGRSSGMTEIISARNGTYAARPVYISTDGGDTWEEASGYPTYPVMPIITPVNIHGVSYDGISVSVDDWRSVESISSPHPMSIPLLIGGDSETVAGIQVVSSVFQLTVFRGMPLLDTVPTYKTLSIPVYHDAFSTYAYCGWVWQSTILLLVRDAANTVSAYRSLDAGNTWTRTTTSENWLKSWQ